MTAPAAALVLGRTARALRGDHKTSALAQAVTDAGLKWSTGHVAQLEAGRLSPTVTTLYALASAFSALLGRKVTLGDMLAGDGSVKLGDRTEVELETLRAALAGKPVEPPSPAKVVAASMARLEEEIETWPQRLRERFGQMPGGWHKDTVETFVEADWRVAQQLGISRSRAIAEMALLWHRSLSAEQTTRPARPASQQKRGRISRKLKQN